MPGNNHSSIWIVIGVILFSLFIGWLTTELNDTTTLYDEAVNYQEPSKGIAITGQTITKPDDDGWSMWSIPLLGPLLSILIGVLTLGWNLLITFFTGLNALLILPTFLPSFMQTVLNWIEIGIVSILLLTWIHGRGG